MARRMKDSGVAWIGQVPVGWEVERLQWHIKELNDKNTPIVTTNVLSLTNDKGVIPYKDRGNQGNKAKEDYSEYKLAYENTIIANSMNILIGSVGLSKYNGCVSPVYYIFKNRENTSIDFLNYLFQMRQFQRELRKYANGILEIRLRVSATDIMKRMVAFPLLAEQERIAKFLDKKCGEIDELSEKVKAQIEKLEAYKKSIITEAVTPKEGWEVKRLKNLFAFGKGLDITKADLVDKGIPVVSYGQIHAKYNVGVRLDDSLLRFVPEDYLADNDSRILRKNEFAFADTSEDLEGLGNFVLNDTDKTVFAGYHTIIFRPKTELPYKYLAYLFLSDAWRSQLRTRCSGIKVYSLTQKVLNATSVVMPPEKECEKIVKHLDKKCGKVDEIIRQRKAQLEKLAEYKKSLIYEYVTGKKEVSA